MAPPSIPGSAALLLLLLLAVVGPQHAIAQYEDTRLQTTVSKETAAVAPADQVSSNQAFSKTWQVKKSAVAGGASVIDGLDISLPGRVFVSYTESASSDLLAEVVVSGSSKAIVEVVDIHGDLIAGILAGNTYGVKDAVMDDVATGAFLLTEIKLHQKRTVKKINPWGTGEFVVLDNVLFSKTKEDFAALTSEAASAAAKPSTFKLTELTKYEEEDRRVWNLTASNKYAKVNLNFSIPGYARTDTLRPEDASPGTIAVIKLGAELDETSAMDKFEIVATQSNGLTNLEFRPKPSHNIQGLYMATYIFVLPSVQLNIVDSVVDRFADFRSNAYPTNGFSTFTSMDGNGAVFISDKEASLYLDEADFIGITGNLQVDVGELSSTSMVLQSISDDSIDFFATSISTITPITATVSGNGSICISSGNNLEVTQLDANRTAQVSYTGKPSARKCVKRELPERVPGKIVMKKDAESSSSASGALSPATTPSPTSSDVKAVKSRAGTLDVAFAAAFGLATVAVVMAI
ncbi:hypothetical protein Gpo141_00009964 [Globisporangium polare]